MATKQALAEIKRDLDAYIGKRVKLKSFKGRNRVVEREGVLERTYPSIFVIKLDEKKVERRISFSYTDVLTESVELTVCREDGEIKIAAARN
ncbi:hypothetical protein Tph_c28620 [Thermacetogenium phaeum DSM 12270]|jgi:uncharacterized protein Veg|uniref:Veg protein n=2 Tax=Thermacetogenium phaeum TaxID=85874 RepID=K4LLP4_THEPS|nr:Veg family protein [Thermacetogenium phaeum]AFV13027.1 hypothetical protein Tph_c28620 [Thermacetogenium phaeum DSM 12270]